MRRLKQAIRGRIHAIQVKLYQRIEELAFQASVRAFRETRHLVHESALAAANQALAAYEPPTPWAEAWVDEVTQVLDSVIAEQFRLQSQVEELERLLREALASREETGDAREETGDRRQETGAKAA